MSLSRTLVKDALLATGPADAILLQGWVRTRRDAQWVYYSIDPEAWRAFAAPLAAFFGTLDLPPTASLGAGSRCEPRAEDGCRP